MWVTAITAMACGGLSIVSPGGCPTAAAVAAALQSPEAAAAEGVATVLERPAGTEIALRDSSGVLLAQRTLPLGRDCRSRAKAVAVVLRAMLLEASLSAPPREDPAPRSVVVVPGGESEPDRGFASAAAGLPTSRLRAGHAARLPESALRMGLSLGLSLAAGEATLEGELRLGQRLDDTPLYWTIAAAAEGAREIEISYGSASFQRLWLCAEAGGQLGLGPLWLRGGVQGLGAIALIEGHGFAANTGGSYSEPGAGLNMELQFAAAAHPWVAASGVLWLGSDRATANGGSQVGLPTAELLLRVGMDSLLDWP